MIATARGRSRSVSGSRHVPGEGVVKRQRAGPQVPLGALPLFVEEWPRLGQREQPGQLRIERADPIFVGLQSYNEEATYHLASVG